MTPRASSFGSFGLFLNKHGFKVAFATDECGNDADALLDREVPMGVRGGAADRPREGYRELVEGGARAGAAQAWQAAAISRRGAAESTTAVCDRGSVMLETRAKL